jgi:pimeloyl-ACP methyl ester carboxylesterase
VHGHELLVLHGQPGLGSDWQQVVDRLPRELHVAALDRPGYGANRQGAGGFDFNARAVLAEMDARGIERAVLVGHSYGGGVALSVARLAPQRAEALVLLASVGPGCLTGWDRLLAAPVAGEICALAAWSLTPWLARARLNRIAGRRGRPIASNEHVSWDIWGNSRHDHGPLWRSFLTEQRALVAELDDLTGSLAGIQRPVLLLADPRDALIPVETAYELAALLPAARLQLLEDVGHHLPRRGAAHIAEAVIQFLAELDDRPDPALRSLTAGADQAGACRPSRHCSATDEPIRLYGR